MMRVFRTRNRNALTCGLLLAVLLLWPGLSVRGQRGGEGDDVLYSLKFNQAPLEMVLDDFSQKTQRTLLQGPKVPKTMITLRSQGGLTLDEYLQAVEALLAMNGIGLVKVGDKFIKVVPIAEARQEAMAIGEQQFEPVLGANGQPVTNAAGVLAERFVGLSETDELVSQLIMLKHILLADAKAAIEPLKHAYGQINTFESMNALLITDTAANINRIMKILQYIDQPVEAREEPHIIAIKHSKASEIKQKLEELIADSEEENRRPTPVRKTTGSPGTVLRTPPGVIRATVPTPAPVSEVTEEIVAQAERGIIRGKVKIVADDRTNILIIITRPENMKYFEKIVQVLDVETSPDVIVRVIRLEFADAKEIAGMLNDLIGAATAKDEPPSGSAAPVPEGGSTALREIKAKPKAAASPEGASKVGELSKDNIKILADERTNSLIIMASLSDFTAMEAIVSDMDMMLSQVLVEAVVLEVNLGDTFESGFDWLQRSLIAYNQNAQGSRSPIASFAGSGGGGNMAPSDSLAFTDVGKFPSDPAAGLTYYLTFFDLNLDTVLRLVATDSNTKILSSPVILTTDNKDATIDVSTERYFYKGKKYVGTSGNNNPYYEDDVETKKVGISLVVTPRINAKKFVVMEIAQQIDNVSGVQTINGTDWPVVTTRKLEADIAVGSGDTIVLGGLVLNQNVKTENKIPLLGDIPLLGMLFRSQRDENTRNEVIVFITPYVLNTPEEMEADARRRADAANIEGMWKRGWSNSRLAEPNKADLKAAEEEARRAKQEAKEQAREARRREKEPPPAPELNGLQPEIVDFVSQENERWDGVLDKVDKEIEQEVATP